MDSIDEKFDVMCRNEFSKFYAPFFDEKKDLDIFWIKC